MSGIKQRKQVGAVEKKGMQVWRRQFGEEERERSNRRRISGVLRVRLADTDARRFNDRLDKLIEEFQQCDDPKGKPYGLAVAIYRRAVDA